MKRKTFKHIACFLTMVMFTQSVPAESLMAVGERVRETVSGISDTFDDKENNRLNVVDDVISSGADLVKDIVISDAALNK